MNSSRLLGVYLTIFLLITLSCSDQTLSPPNQINNKEKVQKLAKGEKDLLKPVGRDFGMIMRNKFRSMKTDSLLEMVEKADHKVMIGFREIGAERGVTAKGRQLVSDLMVESLSDSVIQKYAQEIIYRFKNIPAVTVRLQNAEMALRLRALPWIDYVAASSGLVTPDAINSTCSGISSPPNDSLEYYPGSS